MFCRYKHMMQTRVRMLLFVTQLDLVTTVGDRRQSCLLQWMNGVVGSTRHGKLIAKNKLDISSRFEYCITYLWASANGRQILYIIQGNSKWSNNLKVCIMFMQPIQIDRDSLQVLCKVYGHSVQASQVIWQTLIWYSTTSQTITTMSLVIDAMACNLS
jgi:hypothetical protein